MDGRLRSLRATELAMARELRWWLAAVLLACGAVAVAYLPPRGAARGVGLRDEPFRQTTARLRAQALAAQWRTASLALRLPEYRKRLQPELLRRRERDEPGPALLVEAPDSVAAFARQRLRATLDTVSGQLGLGVTKVSVGLVVDLWRYVSANAGETPSQDFESPGYLFPDSSDRTTCVALIPAWRWTGTLAVQPQVRHQRVEDMLRTALGPCAFYAAYGTPGRGVRHWLAKRGYDLARVPLWDRERPERPQDSFVMYQDGTRWWWGSVYRFPVTAMGCPAGCALSCRAADGGDRKAIDAPPPPACPVLVHHEGVLGSLWPLAVPEGDAGQVVAPLCQPVPYAPAWCPVGGVEGAGPEGGPEHVFDSLVSHLWLDRERPRPTPGRYQRHACRPIARIGKQVAGRLKVLARRFAGIGGNVEPQIDYQTYRDLGHAEPQLARDRIQGGSQSLAGERRDGIGCLDEQRGTRLVSLTPPQ